MPFGSSKYGLTPELTIPELTETADEAYSGADAQISVLNEAYAEYRRAIYEFEQQSSAMTMFASWFRGGDDPVVLAANAEFYNKMKTAFGLLVAHLRVLDRENREECEAMGRVGMDIIMNPVPTANRTKSDFMCLAAELLTEPIFPLLSRDDLERYHQAYVTAYPKKERYPNQKKLVKAMEEQLKK